MILGIKTTRRRAVEEKYAPAHFLPPPPRQCSAAPRVSPQPVAGLAFNFSKIEVPVTRTRPTAPARYKKKDSGVAELMNLHGALPGY